MVRLVVYVVVAVMASRLARSLKDHAATAERALNETRRRQETDQLREALIGSVSHELRTPLSSILGATTVLCSAAAVRAEPQLEALAGVVRTETERLNNVIQNLLDATRISSEGLRPRFEWAEIADIVNAALEKRRMQLGARVLDVDLAPELPLVYVDPVMVEQALEQLLDNAAKYSPESEPVRITARAADGAVALSVIDRGAGLSQDELARLGERFFRGPAHRRHDQRVGLRHLDRAGLPARERREPQRKERWRGSWRYVYHPAADPGAGAAARARPK